MERSAAAAVSYDEVAYPGHALAQAHPDRLATLATLFGLNPPPVPNCRVLEIGCGDGINLISVAQGLPRARCLGIDLARSGLERGQEVIDALGVDNVTLKQANILDIGPDFGEFDYIIAHGIYSWVPEGVRDRLLALCRERLSENGVAYISYNTYPGNHIRNLVRGMIKFHVAERSDPEDKIGQSRGLLKFFAAAATEDPHFYRDMLARECERLGKIPDAVLIHDDLADVNVPVHFHEFVAHANRHGLQYLSEAQFFEMESGLFSKETIATLNEIADSRVAKEQYLDFLKCRSFRQTLLVQSEQRLDFAVDPLVMERFCIASPAQLNADLDAMKAPERVTIQGPHKSAITTDNPLVQHAFHRLGAQWPAAVPFMELVDYAHARVARGADGPSKSVGEEARTLAETLLKTYAAGMIELSVSPPKLTNRPGEKPLASPLARLQATLSPKVINLRHHNIRIDDMLGRSLLTLLDGTRDRANITCDLLALIDEQAEDLLRQGLTRAALAQMRMSVERELDDNIDALARMALLVA